MEMNPTLLAVWAVLAAAFFALLVYRGQLTRYEDEQLFLNEEINAEGKQRQARIVRKVQRLEPVLRLCGGAAGLVTVSVVGLYVWRVWAMSR